jgi:hypothetical protein
VLFANAANPGFDGDACFCLFRVCRFKLQEVRSDVQQHPYLLLPSLQEWQVRCYNTAGCRRVPTHSNSGSSSGSSGNRRLLMHPALRNVQQRCMPYIAAHFLILPVSSCCLDFISLLPC